MFTDIQNNMNFLTILSNQDEILQLLRSLIARQSVSVPVDVTDLMPTPLSTVEELRLLCEKLDGDEDFKFKLVIYLIHTL